MNDDEQALQARIELLDLKYPRATRASLMAFDRAYRITSFALTTIGAITVLHWLVF